MTLNRNSLSLVQKKANCDLAILVTIPLISFLIFPTLITQAVKNKMFSIL